MTWTQVAQYIILIIAYILPVAILSAQLYGVPIPELTYGQALQRIGELEEELGVVKAHVAPFLNLDALNFFALILCLMIGTASLPHILMRYFTTPTVRDRASRSPGRCSSSFCSISPLRPMPRSPSSRSIRTSSVRRSQTAGVGGELGHGGPRRGSVMRSMRRHHRQMRARQGAGQR